MPFVVPFIKLASASTYKFLQRCVKTFILYPVNLELYHKFLMLNL